jgi:hypothetical protein
VATARWLCRWLSNSNEPVTEPELSIATDAELQCTQTGQVLTQFHDVSVFELNRRRMRELKRARDAEARASSDSFRADVKRLLGIDHWVNSAVRPSTGAGDKGRTLNFEVEPGLVLPTVEVNSQRRAGGNGLTVIKVGADWQKELGSETSSKRPIGPGEKVILVDPRGMGKTTPRAERPDQRRSPFGRDWKEAYIALHVARPLLGQRVADLLRILAGLAADSGEKAPSGFHVVGIGAAGPVVMHAALLDDRGLIKQVSIERSLVSWSDVVERGISRDRLASVVPGVLQVYDLPDLAARLAPLPLAIEAPVDAMGGPVSQATLEEVYARAVTAYAGTGVLRLHGSLRDHGLTPSR